MPYSEKTLDSIRNNNYIAQIEPQKLEGVILWIIDHHNTIVDISPQAAAYAGLQPQQIVGRNMAELDPLKAPERYEFEHALIFKSGQPSTLIKWECFSVGWRKFIQTKTPLADEFILVVAHDITDADPLNQWLLSVDVVNQRLALGERYHNAFIQLPEWLVLHRLVRGKTYKEIAGELNITEDTVNYRMRRLQQKLGVTNMAELWEEIYSGGLVHMLTLPLGLDQLPDGEAEFLERDPSVGTLPEP
jgi:hypothetical protein